MHKKTQKVIVLGAGRSKQLTTNPSLVNISLESRTLDWILHAFDPEKTEYHFVGGYQLDTIAHKYHQFSFSLNPDWESTGCIGSLGMVDLEPPKPTFICYGDILFRSRLVDLFLEQAEKSNADVWVALDSDPALLEAKPDGETLNLDASGNITAASAVFSQKQAFVGLIYLSPKAVRLLAENFPIHLNNERLSHCIEFFQKAGLRVASLDANGLWTEVNDSRDVARFVLNSKAQTLQTLQKRLRSANIEDQIHFSVAEWQNNGSAIIKEIVATFSGKKCIVRSSSQQEDGFAKANAGKFLSLLDVEPKPEALTRAIQEVIASYGTAGKDDLVLVQPMLASVIASGVAFTRTLSYGAPYLVLNYDAQDTAAITSGNSSSDQIFYHWKSATLPQNAPVFFQKLWTAIQEIEHLVHFDALDIEFAVTEDGEIYIFQVRPIAVKHLRELDDAALHTTLQMARKHFQALQTPSPFVVGDKTLFGVMPDWNPAEIVGIKPSLLAISTYQQLITNDVWAQQRTEFGYRDVRPHPLIVCFGGHPYVDVRASINSFIPKKTTKSVTQKLVNCFIQRLEQHPEWHDKLEFKVMPTCYTFNFEAEWASVLTKEAWLTSEEFEAYKQALREITQSAFHFCTEQFDAIEVVDERFYAIKNADMAILEKIGCLFETCKRGTLVFSHLARCGFIASALINSSIEKGLLTKEEKEDLLRTFETITGIFSKEVQAVAAGKQDRHAFVEKYGHLRPGTYDITSPAYKTDPQKFLFGQGASTSHTESSKTKSLSELRINEQFQKTLQNTFDLSLETFQHFLHHAVAGREYAKFVFTKYLSLILDLIESLGREWNLSTQALSNLAITDILELRNGIRSDFDVKKTLHARIEEMQTWHHAVQSIELPPLLTKPEDFFSFFVPKSLPNFVGNKQVVAPLVYLKNSSKVDVEHLRNKIVLVEKADPGFDWVFNYAIAGLITVYGGPNSHMAIRSAELGLPASIGVGSALFESLKRSNLVELDCQRNCLKILQ